MLDKDILIDYFFCLEIYSHCTLITCIIVNMEFEIDMKVVLTMCH